MAAVSTTGTAPQVFIDYLKRRLPPYMEARIYSDPFRDNSINLNINTKLAVHFTDDPIPDHLTVTNYFREIHLMDIDRNNPAAVFDHAIKQIMHETAEAIGSGNMNGRTFDKFAFEGGQVQELNPPAPPNVIDTRPMIIKTEADLIRVIYNAKNNGQKTDTLWVTPSQQAMILGSTKSIYKVINGRSSHDLYFHGHKIEVKH
jgi:hypothetical protein